jgi:hypothetical protein
MTKAEAVFRLFFTVDGVFDEEDYFAFRLARRVVIEALTYEEAVAGNPYLEKLFYPEEFPQSYLHVFADKTDPNYGVFDDKPSYIKQDGTNFYGIQWRVYSEDPVAIQGENWMLHRPFKNGPASIYINLNFSDDDEDAVETNFYTNGKRLEPNPKYWWKEENLTRLMNWRQSFVKFVRAVDAT